MAQCKLTSRSHGELHWRRSVGCVIYHLSLHNLSKSRNTAKNRQREPESRPHFRTPFTSSGIAIHRKVEAYNAPRAPTFDLRHAGNAPFEVPLHDKAPLQSPSNRIDSIPSTAWELEDSNQVDSPKRFSIDHTTPSNYDGMWTKHCGS